MNQIPRIEVDEAKHLYDDHAAYWKHQLEKTEELLNKEAAKHGQVRVSRPDLDNVRRVLLSGGPMTPDARASADKRSAEFEAQEKKKESFSKLASMFCTSNDTY